MALPTSPTAKKHILLNAFEMNGVGHLSVGQWRNPDDQSLQKTSLDYWLKLAQLLEKGCFTAVFLADNFGSHDVYQNSHEPAIRAGSQWPVFDPFVIISAMAAVTKNLNFGITACTTFEAPFILAKRFSTLDHLTNGRVAWNIVTSWSESAARAMGLDKLPEHDDRYAMANEYVELTYKLWEGSWADNALVADAAQEILTEPERIRKISHHGKYFNCDSAHQVSPSPQRTPVLFQAGMSKAGAQFGAKHAECIFVSGPNPSFLKEKILETRKLIAAEGRNPAAVKFFMSFTPILGASTEEAQKKLEQLQSFSIPEGSLAKFCAIHGFDLSVFDLDEEFPTDVNHPKLETYNARQKEILLNRPQGFKAWTPRLLSQWTSIGGSGPIAVGSGALVADEMERWITEADVDGFNLGHVAVPQSWEDIIEHLIPELRRRGWLGDGGYPVPGGTFRENLSGQAGDNRLHPTHPASRFKFDQYGTQS